MRKPVSSKDLVVPFAVVSPSVATTRRTDVSVVRADLGGRLDEEALKRASWWLLGHVPGAERVDLATWWVLEDAGE